MNLVKLLQLASPILPVGAYSYSGGLEAAIEAGVVSDAASAERWIGDVLEFSIARMEGPVLFSFICSFNQERLNAIQELNERFLASRETAELRAETVQMGYSLNRLFEDLGLGEVPVAEPSFPAAYAYAAAQWKIEPEAALQAYLWAWLENQVMAAMKAVPLGQTDGQRILLSLGGLLPSLTEKAKNMKERELGNFAPGLAMLSAKHETQYSRLFRS
ncbi:MAG: urease accessory protein UreF [Betaproteobacteria bacterium RBG_16_66_20]|nr:MAG: urease accessory protein UreF [Betaproteobacteria bacterium RBG_16_66_20]